MRRAWCVGLFVSVLLTSGHAAADTVTGARSEKLKETAHRVQITLAPSHASLRVQRSVWNGGPRHDEATFMIDVPAFSVATALATLGTKNGRPFWYRGELMEAEAAAAKYRELTGIGGFYPKDPALLSWREQSLLALQVFPCPPNESKWIEYTLDIPTRYERGRYFIELARVGTEKLPALASLQPKTAGDRVLVDEEPFVPGSALRLERESPVRLELAPKRMARFEGEFSAFEFADERVLTRFRVAAAPRISAAPAQAKVVVLLDGSHSLAAFDRVGALAATRAYLSRFPGAAVEIAAFDREVHPKYGKLVPVGRALKDLEIFQIFPRNGSHVDRALAYADGVLERQPAGMPRRILILTDARTRRTLTPETLRSALANSAALVHVAVITGGHDDALERDDEHALSSFTRPTGGLVWNTSVSLDGDLEAQADLFEEWVRPKRLHHVVLSPSNDELELSTSLAAEEDDLSSTELHEGEAIDVLGIAAIPREHASIRGELWGEPVELSFERDEQVAKRWSALVFGTELLHSLSEPEMMVLARHGGAVSPVTSYIAIEPGVRPSTEGLEYGTGQGFGDGLGRLSGSGRGSSATAQFNHQEHLRSLARDAMKACGGGARALRVEIETTLHEIVEISGLTLTGADDPKLAFCVEARIWSAALPRAFNREAAVYSIALG
jgi:hypothetical protein